MEIGYRIMRPDDIGAQPLKFAQISLWKAADWGVSDGDRAVSEAISMAEKCRKQGIRTVFHPLEYSLSNQQAEKTAEVFRRLSHASDLGIIIHDEGGEDGDRLSSKRAAAYEHQVRTIAGLCHVSIENSFHSKDILWFWERFVLSLQADVSITIDIGHLETAGVDSITFISELPQPMVDRVRFVHIHHQGEERYGVKDHWPLVPGCRELDALQALLRRKRDLFVILELDAWQDEHGESIQLLRDLE